MSCDLRCLQLCDKDLANYRAMYSQAQMAGKASKDEKKAPEPGNEIAQEEAAGLPPIETILELLGLRLVDAHSRFACPVKAKASSCSS